MQPESDKDLIRTSHLLCFSLSCVHASDSSSKIVSMIIVHVFAPSRVPNMRLHQPASSFENDGF